MNSPVWSDPNYLKLWMYCLMKATHKEREIIVGNAVVTLEPGQFITGRESLADDLNKGAKPKQRLSEKTWYRYLENLERWQMLTINKTNKYSVISILKWAEYQGNDHQMSNKSPSDDHQMSTNKNVKNVKNLSSSSMVDSDLKEVMEFYQSNLQAGITESPHNQSVLLEIYDDWGKELLLAAMKLASEQEKKGTAFLKGILNNWKEAGVQTVEDARRHEKEFRNRRTSKVTPINRRKTAGEIDWDSL